MPLTSKLVSIVLYLFVVACSGQSAVPMSVTADDVSYEQFDEPFSVHTPAPPRLVIVILYACNVLAA